MPKHHHKRMFGTKCTNTGRTPYEIDGFDGFLDTRPGLAPNGPKWNERPTTRLFTQGSGTPCQDTEKLPLASLAQILRGSHDKIVYAGFWDTVSGYRKTSTGQFGTNFEGFWDTVTPYWDAEQLPPGPMDQNVVNTLRKICF